MLQRMHSAILSTIIKLPFSIKTFVLSFFEWPRKTGFTVAVSFFDTFKIGVLQANPQLKQFVRAAVERLR